MTRHLPSPVPGAVAAMALVLALAGCTGDPAPTPTGSGSPVAVSGCVEPGPVSDGVVITGDLGAEPNVSFEEPLEVEHTQRTVAIEGGGAAVTEGSVISLDFMVYDGTTGAVATGTPYAEQGRALVVVDEEQLLPGFVATLLCSTEGSRVVGVVPAEDAFGGEGQPDLGIAAGDTIVFVADIVSVLPTQADGEERPLPQDFPALDLEFADDGQPTVGVPEAEPPADLKIGVLLAGDGPVVGPQDEFTVHYQGVNWRTGEVFDETWGDAPRSFTSVISGFAKAVVGQTVGSRVVVVVPPGEGYGAGGNEGAGIEGSDTIVFVIDILAAAPPA